MKKKGTSKICLLLNQQEQDQSESKHIYDTNADECSPIELFRFKTIQSLYEFKMKDECITVYFLVTIKEMEHQYNIKLFTSGDTNISKVIQKAIRKFNEEEFTFNDPKFNSSLYTIGLREDNISEYELKPCKKTGYPKYDYPSFNHRMQVSNAQTTNFAILFSKTLLVLLPWNKSNKDQMCKDIKCLII